MDHIESKSQVDGFKPFTVLDMPGSDYHADQGISSSQLKSMAVSPEHYWHKHCDPERPADEDKPQFVFGRLAHTMVLEPEKFASEFVIEPEGINKRTKAGKEEYAAWRETVAGRDIVNRADQELAMTLAEAVDHHHAAREVLSCCTDIELSGWWQDDRTGQLLKYRPDARGERMIVDLKTTTGTVDYETVQRAIWNFNYHTSAAHYLDGDRACFGTDHDTFVLIFVSKQWPHDVGVYYLDTDAIELGRRQNRTWLHQIAACKESGNWPPVNNGQITEIGLPAYALKKLKG